MQNFYLSFCRPELRAMDFFNPNGNGRVFPTRVEAGPAHLNHHVMGLDRECIDRVKSQETPWNLVHRERQKCYLKSIFFSDKIFTTKNKSIDVLSCTCRKGFRVSQSFMGIGWVGPYNPVNMCSWDVPQPSASWWLFHAPAMPPVVVPAWCAERRKRAWNFYEKWTQNLETHNFLYKFVELAFLVATCSNKPTFPAIWGSSSVGAWA